MGRETTALAALLLGALATASMAAVELTGDIDQDGCLETLVVSRGPGGLRLAAADGRLLAEIPTAAAPEACALRDADGDGLPDLVAGEAILLAGRDLLRGDRDIIMIEQLWTSGDALNNVWDATVADFDGDGLQSIVGQAYYYPGTLVRVFENTGHGDFTEVWASPEQSTPSIVALGQGDSDGDGQPEILAGEAGTLGRLYMWENTGDDAFEARALGVQVDWQVREVHVADTDGDGEQEIIGIGSNSSDGGSVKLFEHVGPVGTNTYALVHDYDTVSYLLGGAVGDADNDGNMEILLEVGGWAGFPTTIRRLEYNPGAGTWEHKLFEASTTGLPISALIADVDGDDLNELVIGSSEVIHVFESEADDTFTPVWSSDHPVAGDVMDLALGPPSVFGPNPIVAACTFDGQANLFVADGGDYWTILDQFVWPAGALRSVDMGYFDGPDLPGETSDLVFANSATAVVSMYEFIVSTAAPEGPGTGSAGSILADCNPCRDGVGLRFVAGTSWTDGVEVFDPSGRRIRALDLTAGGAAYWDGRDEEGRPTAGGVYLIRATGEAGREKPTVKIVLLR